MIGIFVQLIKLGLVTVQFPPRVTPTPSLKSAGYWWLPPLKNVPQLKGLLEFANGVQIQLLNDKIESVTGTACSDVTKHPE